jgi:hypothetical protein
MDHVLREEAPRDRLEGWLDRAIQGGGLKGLPRYHPLRGGGGGCPEEYARALLAGLRLAGGNPPVLERLRDDGRAFRGWAERAVIPRGAAG